jgi:hypothetical protein
MVRRIYAWMVPGAAPLAIEAISLSIAQGLWDNSLIAFSNC